LPRLFSKRMDVHVNISCPYRSHSYSRSGFTLLEVMIAVALIAIGFVTLLGSQSRSLSRVTEAKFNNIAPILASTKFAEVAGGMRTLVEDEGDFGADFSDYNWHLYIQDIDTTKMQIPADFGNKLQRASLVVAWGKTTLTYTLTAYVRRKE
jgi:prepilin-type N-terminal cleavage/methylation domain-containing protein